MTNSFIRTGTNGSAINPGPYAPTPHGPPHNFTHSATQPPVSTHATPTNTSPAKPGKIRMVIEIREDELGYKSTINTVALTKYDAGMLYLEVIKILSAESLKELSE